MRLVLFSCPQRRNTAIPVILLTFATLSPFGAVLQIYVQETETTLVASFPQAPPPNRLGSMPYLYTHISQILCPLYCIQHFDLRCNSFTLGAPFPAGVGRGCEMNTAHTVGENGNRDMWYVAMPCDRCLPSYAHFLVSLSCDE